MIKYLIFFLIFHYAIKFFLELLSLSNERKFISDDMEELKKQVKNTVIHNVFSSPFKIAFLVYVLYEIGVFNI